MALATTRKEARIERMRTGDVVVWSHIVAAPPPGNPPSGPTVLQNKDGSLMATLRYRGPDVTMLDYTQWCLYLQGWNLLLKRLGSGWAVWVDEWHEPAQGYPQSRWRNPAGYFLDSIRKTVFEEGTLFTLDQYLTLTWLPPSTTKHYWYDSLFVRRAEARRHDEDADQLAQCLAALERFSDALTHLVRACAWLAPKAMLGYLRRQISWDRQTVAIPEGAAKLDLALGTTDYNPGFTPLLHGKYIRPITIRSWPAQLGMMLPPLIQHLAIPYRYTWRHICLDPAVARGILKGMANRWAIQALPLSVHLADAWNGTHTDWRTTDGPVNEEACNHARALEQAISDLGSGDVGYGYGSPVFLVWGDTARQVAERERAVVKLLQQQEFVIEAEREHADEAWRATLVGDVYSNVCNPPFSTRAVVFSMSTGTAWPGDAWDTHWNGPALLTASSHGQPFWFALHRRGSEVGTIMIKGPHRSGKSALLGLMGMQSLRYEEQHEKVQIYAFDRGRSLYCATLMAGGAHYDLGNDGRGFQPLGKLDTEAERRWRHEWLQDLFIAEGMAPRVEERQAMWDALEHLAAQPRPERTLSLYRSYLQVHRLKDALEPYCVGGRFDCFDAAEDSFQLGTTWTTFEMSTLLDLPQHVCALALQYLLHEMEQTFTGCPTLLLLDEFWQFLTHPVFWPKAFLYLKTTAKLNVAIVMSTQEVADSRESPIWQALLGCIGKWVFLPNKQAVSPDVLPQYQACGLSEAHAHLLAQMQAYRDYLVKDSEDVRVMQCAMDRLQRCWVAASTPEEIYELRTLASRPLDEPLQAAWLRAQNFPEAAALYVSLLQEVA